jgi:hypothetical protein
LSFDHLLPGVIADYYEIDEHVNPVKYSVVAEFQIQPLPTIQVQRTPNNRLLYQSIRLSGSTATLNKTSAPPYSAPGWWGVAANYQMDGNYEQQAYTVYLGKLTFTY